MPGESAGDLRNASAAGPEFKSEAADHHDDIIKLTLSGDGRNGLERVLEARISRVSPMRMIIMDLGVNQRRVGVDALEGLPGLLGGSASKRLREIIADRWHGILICGAMGNRKRGTRQRES